MLQSVRHHEVTFNVHYCYLSEPTWENLDGRETPEWYDEAKIGIMIHFGVYSATISSEWFWYNWESGNQDFEEFVKFTRPPGFTYQDYANEFRAELFDPDEWVEIFEEAGAKYVVITAKHHDGFTLYPSSHSFSWNSIDIGPHIDVLKELSDAIRAKSSMKFGIYYSLMEWFNPLYLKDKNESTQNFVVNKILPELKEIIEIYRPEIVWSDGDWEMSDGYWKSKEFLTWLFTNSSVKETVVVNDRWGKGTLCKHGSFVTCKDRFNPGVLQTKKFENALSIDKESWGFDPTTTLERTLTLKELLRDLIMTVACNGNFLLNVGPNKDGRIDNIYVERLKDMGKWLKVNGDGIYGSRSWQHQKQGEDIWFTRKGDHVFVFILEYPFDTNIITLTDFGRFVDNTTDISLLGFKEKLDVSSTKLPNSLISCNFHVNCFKLLIKLITLFVF
jgi:alpha-L-fucosidase